MYYSKDETPHSSHGQLLTYTHGRWSFISQQQDGLVPTYTAQQWSSVQLPKVGLFLRCPRTWDLLDVTWGLFWGRSLLPLAVLCVLVCRVLFWCSIPSYKWSSALLSPLSISWRFSSAYVSICVRAQARWMQLIIGKIWGKGDQGTLYIGRVGLEKHTLVRSILKPLRVPSNKRQHINPGETDS